MGNAIAIPTTAHKYRACLKMAANTLPDHKTGYPLFPGMLNNPTRDKLPMRGHALAATYRTFTTVSAFPMTSQLVVRFRYTEHIKARFIKWAMANDERAIVEARRENHKAMMAALKAKPREAKTGGGLSAAGTSCNIESSLSAGC